MSPQTVVLEVFRCPVCHADLDIIGGDTVQCRACGAAVETSDGVIDLVPADRRGPERTFYDDYYAHEAEAESPATVAELGWTWTGPRAPWEMQVVWDRVGNLRGRTALLLGNGESQAELYFLTKEPRALIYTDLSAVGLAKLRRALRFPADNVVFTAMDALDLPLRDKSVDLVYGFAFAHHLPDLDRFIGEVERVLRPGGRCVMMDNAYAPIWQRLKLVWLRPLMWLSHRREPRSPEDLHDTMAGGFREERLAEVIERAGCDPWAERVAFLYYLWKRASVSLFPGAFRVIPRHDRVAQACLHTDRLLARFAWGRRNMIRLVWGFDKPGNMHARLSRSQH